MILDFLGIGKFFWKILISLVAGVYQLVNYTYQVFLVLAETNIFEQSQYQNLTEKIYVILGVVMLFVIAYNILTLIVDPDKNKGGSSIEKMLKNIVISFVMIVLCPTVFSFAFKFQNAVLEQGVISKVFQSTDLSQADVDNTIKRGGRIMAVRTFSAFFSPTSESVRDNEIKADEECKSLSKKCTLEEAKEYVEDRGSFSLFKAFAGNIMDDEIEFNWFIALIAGGYLVYVIISFCFDLAVRVCKLAFYQIIAPIAIACRILPEKDSIYKNWWKATSKTYLAVFIRVLVMNLGVYLVSLFIDSNFFESACDGTNCGRSITLIAYAFIILGIVTFIRQAPKLLEEIFGLGDTKLGIREKLREGGAFTAGAAVGAGVTSMTRNASHAYQNFKETKGQGWRKRTASALKGIGSTVTGGVMGSYRGGRAGWKAANESEMARAASKGAQETIGARDNREARILRYHADNKNIITGHFSDIGKDIRDWATGGTDRYEAIIKVSAEMDDSFDKIKSKAESVFAKIQNNAKVTPQGMTVADFKGNTGAHGYYTSRYTGMSMAAIKADIERIRAEDVSGMTDAQKRVHAQEIADLDSMYEFMKKKTLSNIQDAAIAGKDWIVGGVKIAEKDALSEVGASISDFQARFKANGSTIYDPIKDETKTSARTAKELKDVADAYQNAGNDAKRKSAAERLDREKRKKDSK